MHNPAAHTCTGLIRSNVSPVVQSTPVNRRAPLEMITFLFHAHCLFYMAAHFGNFPVVPSVHWMWLSIIAVATVLVLVPDFSC